MKITDIFKPPFRADGAFIYSADGVMCLMAANCRYYPREMMSRIVQLINGESRPTRKADVGVNFSEICINGAPVLTVRGWEYLSGTLNLSAEEAENVQSEFAVWVVGRLKGEEDTI